LSMQMVSEKDLENFKEKHHIFWKTYEDLELFPQKIENVKDQCDSYNGNIRVKRKIIDYFKGIKNGFKSNHHDNLTTQKSDGLTTREINCKIDLKNENAPKKEDMNVYCISKNDLLEIITDRLAKQKRKLH